MIIGGKCASFSVRPLQWQRAPSTGSKAVADDRQSRAHTRLTPHQPPQRSSHGAGSSTSYSITMAQQKDTTYQVRILCLYGRQLRYLTKNKPISSQLYFTTGRHLPWDNTWNIVVSNLRYQIFSYQNQNPKWNQHIKLFQDGKSPCVEYLWYLNCN